MLISKLSLKLKSFYTTSSLYRIKQRNQNLRDRLHRLERDYGLVLSGSNELTHMIFTIYYKEFKQCKHLFEGLKYTTHLPARYFSDDSNYFHMEFPKVTEEVVLALETYALLYR